jgi:hypothetical protein
VDRAEEIEFLREALGLRVEQTSLRQAAAEVGMSHGGVCNLVAGTALPYGKTLGKLRDWYLAHWAQGGEGLTAGAARYLVQQLLGPVPAAARANAGGELMDGLEALYRRHGAALPAWLHQLRRELRAPPVDAPG